MNALNAQEVNAVLTLGRIGLSGGLFLYTLNSAYRSWTTQPASMNLTKPSCAEPEFRQTIMNLMLHKFAHMEACSSTTENSKDCLSKIQAKASKNDPDALFSLAIGLAKQNLGIKSCELFEKANEAGLVLKEPETKEDIRFHYNFVDYNQVPA